MRLPRLRLPGIPQHVVIRGNNRHTIFQSDHDCRVCLDYLAEASVKYSCDIHAYVLMPDHLHLLATPADAMGVSRMVQLLARQYVQYYNKHYERSGTLWEGRYKSALVDDASHGLACYQFIESNPLRNNLCTDARDYPWSSHRCNGNPTSRSQRKERIDTLLKPLPSYLSLGGSATERRQHYQQRFTRDLDPAISSLIRRETHRSRVIGSDAFIHRIEQALGIDLANKARGGDHRSKRYQLTVQQEPKNLLERSPSHAVLGHLA